MLIAVGIVLCAWSAIRIRGHMLDGKRAMAQGKQALLAGDANGALQEFVRAWESFHAAEEGASGPVFRALRLLPVLGRTPDAVAALARAGTYAAQAGQAVAGPVAHLPNGLASLAPRAGSVPLDHFAPIDAAVRRADALAQQAIDAEARVPTSLVAGPVAQAGRQARQQLLQAKRDLDVADLLLAGLPDFLGANGPRRYFVGAANPAELRGSAGLIGAFSILTVDHGSFHLSPFRATNILPDLRPSQVRAPSTQFAQLYNQFGGAGFWKNISMSPHFPWVGQAIEAAYAKDTGTKLSGVIVADPSALQGLLAFLGPQRVTALGGARVGAANVVPFIANQAYSQFPHPSIRKRVLGAVAEQVLHRFLQRGGSVAWMRALGKTVSAGHILVHSTDPSLERGLSLTPAGGTFTSPPGDFLSVIQNNGAGSKIDYYQDRTITYTVRLTDGGAAQAVARVTLANHAPSSGQPAYVIGPFPGLGGRPGENILYENLYCAAMCSLQSASRDGHRVTPRSGTEVGHPFFQEYFSIPSGHTSTIQDQLSLRNVWQSDGSGGSYRLTFVNQDTIRPTHLEVAIVAPPGMQITSTSVPMQVIGSSAVWLGEPAGRLTLEVTFQP